MDFGTTGGWMACRSVVFGVVNVNGSGWDSAVPTLAPPPLLGVVVGARR